VVERIVIRPAPRGAKNVPASERAEVYFIGASKAWSPKFSKAALRAGQQAVAASA
jgi:hypothetical protein